MSRKSYMRASLLILAVLALAACASSSTYPLSPVEIQHLKDSQAKRVYYIGGGVKHPGTYRIPSGKSITLSQALAQADGDLDSARLDSVRVFRPVDGAWVVIKCDNRSKRRQLYHPTGGFHLCGRKYTLKRVLLFRICLKTSRRLDQNRSRWLSEATPPVTEPSDPTLKGSQNAHQSKYRSSYFTPERCSMITNSSRKLRARWCSSWFSIYRRTSSTPEALTVNAA